MYKFIKSVVLFNYLQKIKLNLLISLFTVLLIVLISFVSSDLLEIVEKTNKEMIFWYKWLAYIFCILILVYNAYRIINTSIFGFSNDDKYNKKETILNDSNSKTFDIDDFLKEENIDITLSREERKQKILEKKKLISKEEYIINKYSNKES
jgi:predicted membrane protein